MPCVPVPIYTCSPSQDENFLLPDQGRSLPFFRVAGIKVGDLAGILLRIANYWTRRCEDTAFGPDGWVLFRGSLGRSAQRLDSYSADIGADEYRIAVRVGNYFPFADYHFMVQTADGTWAEKHGPGGASVQHPKGNPDTIPWSLPGVSDNFYDSAIVYLAIGK